MLIGRGWHSDNCIQVMALQAVSNQYTCPTYSAKVCLETIHNITNSVNKAGWVDQLGVYFL